jgi:hypothetical protein
LRTVVYVAPFPLPTTLRFANALRSLAGVRLVGITTDPPPPGAPFDDVVVCPDAMADGPLGAALDEVIRRYRGIHRVLGILEPLQEPLARQRARLGLPGLRPEGALRFRDKDVMKQALRAAGVPVAAARRVQDLAEARAFAVQVGFPLVLKPPAGMGAAATTRVDDDASLARAMAQLPRPLLAEQFLRGQEHSLETWVLHGQPVFHSVTRYYPTPLEVAENPHLQWVVHLPRRLDPFAGAVRVVDRAVTALGLDQGIAHAEWFQLPDGQVAIGEVAARPPGARFMDLHGWAHDADLYRAWARLIVDQAWDGPFQRRWSVAGVYLRGPGSGRVLRVEGLDEAQRKMGVHVVDARLPEPGTPRSTSYEGDGFVVIRHPDDDVVKAAALELVRTVRVVYG